MSPPPPVREPIRVLLVDDSPLHLTIIKRMLAGAPDIEIVGTARDGREALELIPSLNPKVICTDWQMPVMDGLEFTRAVMREHPRPILVISSAVKAGSREGVFPMLDAGALDVFPKPQNALASDEIGKELQAKVRLLSGVFVFRRSSAASAGAGASPIVTPVPRQPGRVSTAIAGTAAAVSRGISSLTSPALAMPARKPGGLMTVIGASTGGPQALLTILRDLPANFAAPIVCVQHISIGFLAGLIEWLSSECRLKIKIAAMGEVPRPGMVYFPPEKMHLVFDHAGRLQASDAPPVGGHKPAVTATFDSLAAVYGKSSVAVLLTGMGNDGAAGMLAVSNAGGMTVAQDEASSVVFGMPRQAIALGGARHVLPLGQMAAFLVKQVNRSN